ncbi:MAG: M14 family metallocarboxypeptidase [Verrucomicrobiae bacterium]|nr:M14 family metallocarboxypeptidase [Verrucomicrobiae bacterium]
MDRLGRNHGGYYGERIDLDAVLADCASSAAAHGWIGEPLPPSAPSRMAYRRTARTPGAPRWYLSAGMHGDEPAAPLAAARLLRENDWPDADLWLIPCLNPDGMRLGTRGNAQGVDLNRDYRNPQCAETLGHIEWLHLQPRFDLTLLLHEDWESHGFYTYEANPNGAPSLAPEIIAAAATVCPVDPSPVIDGREISEPGILRPVLTPEERPDWAEALWLIVNHARLNYTLESPSDWPLAVRVEALTRAVRAALRAFTRSATPPATPG